MSNNKHENYYFSLIVATINRKNELNRLIKSLVQQSYNHFELIIVDMNNDENEIASLVSEIHKIKIRIFRPYKKLGASAARNFGSKYAIGNILTFPDDDCWYETNVLFKISNLFNTVKTDVISCSSLDPENNKSNVNFPSKSCYLNFWNIHKGGIEYTVFFKKKSFFDFNGFNENIGIGSNGIFQSGEITDLLYKINKAKLDIYFNDEIKIFHPFKDIYNSKDVSIEREALYSAGAGYVFRNHNAFILFLYSTLRLFIVFLFSLKRYDKKNSILKWVVFKYRIIGFFSNKL